MIEDADVYGHVTSRYYDAIYPSMRAASGDVEFYRARAHEVPGPVLELGCGTGRVLLPIAQDGFPCTGLDVSPRMLDRLRRKPFPPTLRLVCAPMQEFDLPAVRFTLICAPFRVFQHLYTRESQLACLACVRHHLAPGGIFAFDVFSPDPVRTCMEHEPETIDAHFECDGEQIVRYTSVDRDREQRSMVAHMRYARNPDEGILQDDRVDVRLRYFDAEELEKLLGRAGFRNIELYGDFEGRAYTSESTEIVVVAREG